MTTINHECYVSLEVAKLLKQAGFDWKCIRYYQNDDETLDGPLVEQYKLVETNFNVAPVYTNQYSAPTLDVAQRWLREVKDIHVNAHLVYEPIENENRWTTKWHLSYCALPYDADDLPDDEELISHYFNTYEEAQEAGIKKALEIILEKGE